MTTVLTISDLHVTASGPDDDTVEIVSDINVAVAPGEVVALIGESGAGKTTAALVALGYCRPGTHVAGGSVIFDGRDILSLNYAERRKIRGNEIAYVAQSAQAALNPSMTIGRQIIEVMRLHGVHPGAEARRRTIDLLEKLSLPDPEDLFDRYPHQTSGGQQQRIMLAMALACSPLLLVLDEPTTALDVTTQVEVLKTIKEMIRGTGTAALYVSHDLTVIAQIADRVLVLKGGEKVEEGSVRQIVEEAKEDYTKTLIAAVSGEIDLAEQKGRGGAGADAATESPILQVKDIRASYARKESLFSAKTENMVLEDVSLDLYRGEVLAIVGESGCGKSTLARVITGLHRPTGGSIILDGEQLDGISRRRTLEQCRRVQIVFQSPYQSLNPVQRVDQIILNSLNLYFDMAGKEKRDRVEELLGMVGLDPALSRKLPIELSGGQRQRVSIARALAARPDIIVCDEILASLDVVVAAQILETMQGLQENFGVSYLFISHDLTTVRSFADRVAVIYAGSIVDMGPTSDVFASPRHPYTDLLYRSSPELRIGWLEEALEARAGRQGRSEAGAFGGCKFFGRCRFAEPGLCDMAVPDLYAVSDQHHWLCHKATAIRDGG